MGLVISGTDYHGLHHSSLRLLVALCISRMRRIQVSCQTTKPFAILLRIGGVLTGTQWRM